MVVNPSAVGHVFYVPVASAQDEARRLHSRVKPEGGNGQAVLRSFACRSAEDGHVRNVPQEAANLH